MLCPVKHAFWGLLAAWCAVAAIAHAAEILPGSEPPAWSESLVESILADARESGDARRGAVVFGLATSACGSCHKVAGRGGDVGPDLTTVAKCLSPAEIVESLYWPDRSVKLEFRAWAVTTTEGRVLQGVVREEGRDGMLLIDAAGVAHRLSHAQVEDRLDIGSLMPKGLVVGMPPDQRRDLVRYLLELGKTPGMETLSHEAGSFDLPREPLRIAEWPNASAPVNRHRLYEAYSKQAMHFRGRQPMPLLLPAWPGLDGGGFGHWGSAPEASWTDDRRNSSDLGSVQCWPLSVRDRVVPRAVNVRLGDQGELSICFNPDTLAIEAAWKGGFIRFEPFRYGFLSPAKPDGVFVDLPSSSPRPAGPVRYRGFYRHGNRVVFAYRIGDTDYLDAPWVKDGKLVREIAPVATHPDAGLAHGGPAQWPQRIATSGTLGTGRPYAIDTIVPPFDNPWKSLMFFGGHGFFPCGDAAICTMQGDVWRVSGLDADLDDVRWRRIAAGLNQALGLVVENDVVYVLGGDQITRLVDLNGDGETDFYECVCNSFEPSGGHNFKCGLERDDAGNFFTASHQGLLRISPDGRAVDVLAVGFRNPDGLALLPDGTLTVPVSEGDFTPASAICEVRQRAGAPPANPPPDFRGLPPALPLAYLPRGLDNSSGGQAYVSSGRWGPLAGQLVHFSFGTCTHFLVLRDEVEGQPQGAIVPLVGDFRAGVHRGRFAPHDGQLYVSGMNGWQSYSVDDGCFQRVRYVGGTVQQPVRIRVHRNGVHLGFTAPLNASVAGAAANHFAQCWNYRYGPAYGSAEFSPTHYGTPGHDPLTITSATVSSDLQSLFLEIPDIQPVSQLHLHVAIGGEETRDIFATVHRLAEPFRDIPGYAEREQPIAAHPIQRDLAMLEAAVPNPSRQAIPMARPVTIEAGSNLSFKSAEFHVVSGEPIALTFANPDVVPHNWVLVKPGTMAKVGGLADAMITDPKAVARHYVPASKDVVAYADITNPGERQTIYFKAPTEKGRYPFLCTFPGHWKLMHGTMVVDDVDDRARQLFRRDNLVAWCIVPYDARKRGPAERAAMLAKLGFKRFAYDWRPEHVDSFDAEWDALARHGISLDAFWSTPPNLPKLLDGFQQRGLKPAIWVMLHVPAELDQAGKVNHAAEAIRPVAEAAAKAGCRVSIYNHGGWGGEPENMVAVVKKLDMPHVGIVYNQHHGHSHLPRFKEALAAMLPHLHCLNINGMTEHGDSKGKKIMVLGQGDLDLRLASVICESGYDGPIGILGHTQDDAEARLQDNLDGLDWIVGELTGASIPKPTPRTN